MSTQLDVIPNVFDYQSHNIRVFDIDGHRLAFAGDLGAVLGLKDVRSSLRAVDPEQIFTLPRSDTAHTVPGIWREFAPQVQAITLVSEDGAVELVMQSKKPEARKFRRWLLYEVWPSIRDTGSYSVAPPLTEDQVFYQALEIVTQGVEQLTAKVAEMQAKTEAYEALMSAKGSYSMQEAASVLGWGRTSLMAELRRQEILQDNDLPYSQYRHHFKVVASTFPQKGRQVSYTRTDVLPSALPWLLRRLAISPTRKALQLSSTPSATM